MVVKNVNANEIKKIYKTMNIIHGDQNFEIVSSCNSIFYKFRKRCNILNYVIYDESKNVQMIAFVRKVDKSSIKLVGDEELFDYVDVVWGQDVSEEMGTKALQEWFEYLKNEGINKIFWRFLDVNSVTYKILNNQNFCRVNKNNAPLYGEVVENVWIDLKFESYDEYLKSLSKHVRQNIRTAYNRLSREENKNDFIIYMGDDIKSDACKKIYRECIDVYIKRQEERYGAKGIIYNIYYKYINFRTNSFFQDKSFLAVSIINRKVAAFMQGLIIKDKIEIPRFAINEEFSFFSPGMILVNETMKYLYEKETINYLDLCRGTEKYKFQFGGEIHNTANWIVEL